IRRREAGSAARLGAEELLVLALDASPLVGVLGRGLLAGDIGPARGVLAVYLEPLLGHGLAVRNDRLDRAFRFAHPAIDAFVGVDDQHVLAFVEAIDRAHLDAIHVFAADAGFSDDVGHGLASLPWLPRPRANQSYRSAEAVARAKTRRVTLVQG